MKTLKTLLVAIAVVALPASASAWDVHGADVLQRGQGAFEASVGWPEVRVGYGMGVIPNLEVVPRLTLTYGPPGGAFQPGLGTALQAWIGDTLGATIRYQVYGKDHLYIAVEGDPALYLMYPVAKGAKFGLGIQLGLPALSVSYKLLDDKLSINSGLNMPIVIVVHPSPVQAWIPIMFRAGVEYAIFDKLHVFLQNEFGPSIFTCTIAGKSFHNTWFAYTVQAGVGYRFF